MIPKQEKRTVRQNHLHNLDIWVDLQMNTTHGRTVHSFLHVYVNVSAAAASLAP